MSIFNDKALKGVADAVSKIMDEELKGNQHKIDANHNGKIDGQDFKILRAKKNMKEEEQVEEGWNDHMDDPNRGTPEQMRHRADISKERAKNQLASTGQKSKPKNSTYTLGFEGKSKTMTVKKEEVELDEAFPTVADGEKNLRAKEGKTSSGTVTKTKTGLVHKRDYKDDDNDADDAQKKPKGYGARQNFKRSTRVNEQKLSFTEMLQLYNESGIEVISKIVPQTVKFGDTEVEVIDANIVNGAVGITVAEEVDNETFTKEVEAQKEKNAGRGKKAEVAKASVQAVKQEEVELDEAKKMEYDQKKVYHLQYVVGVLEDAKKQFTKLKDTAEVIAVIDKAINVVAKEYTKHLNALSAGRGQDDNFKVAEMISKLKFKKSKKTNEEVEQIDEISKSTLGSYIKKASHDVAMKGAVTRHFADKSRRETEEKKHDLAKDSMKRSDRVFTSGMKRREGMAKAVDRLTKEETQLNEKLPASASAGDYIHDFVHSDNPKFAGKSTKERQKMALGAFYAKNKGK